MNGQLCIHRRLAIGLVSGALLLGGTGCRKHDSVPYFPFPAQEQHWLQAQNGDEWVFENAQGKQLRFRLDLVQTRTRNPVPVVGTLGNQGVLAYFDDYRFTITRVDSFSAAGAFLFRSIPEAGDERSKAGVYLIDSEWKYLIGTSLPDGHHYCQRLGVAGDGDLRLVLATVLTVRGRRYDHVLHFAAGATLPTFCRQGASRPAMSQVWYDRRAGIVQMQGVSGELWERLP